jgi:tRNA (uracil-5-)-methyltransferase
VAGLGLSKTGEAPISEDDLERCQLETPGRELMVSISGGCQLQPLPYQLQLAHKKRTVQLAYQRYFSLDSSLLPEVKETIPSPKQWGYRTKITPHFDAPPKWSRAKAVPPTHKAKTNGTAVDEEASANGAGDGQSEETAMNAVEGGAGAVIGGKGASEAGPRKWECRIGFERKGRPGVMDIEVGPTNYEKIIVEQVLTVLTEQECPIATPVLNAKLAPERARINE